jgi:hypothetical protein
MPEYPILSTEYWVLELYKQDVDPNAVALPASLSLIVDSFQAYRNMIANVQDECDTFCVPAWIYKQWKDTQP